MYGTMKVISFGQAQDNEFMERGDRKVAVRGDIVSHVVVEMPNGHLWKLKVPAALLQDLCAVAEPPAKEG